MVHVYIPMMFFDYLNFMSSYYRKARGDEHHMSFNESQLDIYNPGNIKITDNKNITLMYMVEDVDKEYGRLMNSNYRIEFIRIPTIMPWGVKSFIFKDLDGNEIIF